MINLKKITVATLRDAMNLFPDSSISSDGKLYIYDESTESDRPLVGICARELFGNIYLVDDSGAENYLIIGQYDPRTTLRFNKLRYMGKMEYVPKAICTVHKEWELQE